MSRSWNNLNNQCMYVTTSYIIIIIGFTLSQSNIFAYKVEGKCSRLQRNKQTCWAGQLSMPVVALPTRGPCVLLQPGIYITPCPSWRQSGQKEQVGKNPIFNISYTVIQVIPSKLFLKLLADSHYHVSTNNINLWGQWHFPPQFDIYKLFQLIRCSVICGICSISVHYNINIKQNAACTNKQIDILVFIVLVWRPSLRI